MRDYLFIQSQDHFYDARTRAQYEMAIALAETQQNVSILLVQNAVLAARRGTQNTMFDTLGAYRVKLYADELSLQQREIQPDDIHAGINPANIKLVIDAMLNGDKVVWW